MQSIALHREQIHRLTRNGKLVVLRPYDPQLTALDWQGEVESSRSSRSSTASEKIVQRIKCGTRPPRIVSITDRNHAEHSASHQDYEWGYINTFSELITGGQHVPSMGSIGTQLKVTEKWRLLGESDDGYDIVMYEADMDNTHNADVYPELWLSPEVMKDHLVRYSVIINGYKVETIDNLNLLEAFDTGTISYNKRIKANTELRDALISWHKKHYDWAKNLNKNSLVWAVQLSIAWSKNNLPENSVKKLLKISKELWQK